MNDHADRLERLLTEDAPDCNPDIDQHLTDLETYRDTIPDDTDTDRTALQTLGDDTRYTITRLLAAADRELCVCEINPLLEVSDSAISHALSDLAAADLVTRRKDGNWRYYTLTDRANALLTALDITREQPQ